jgi:hypothetical protein
MKNPYARSTPSRWAVAASAPEPFPLFTQSAEGESSAGLILSLANSSRQAVSSCTASQPGPIVDRSMPKDGPSDGRWRATLFRLRRVNDFGPPSGLHHT